MCVCCFGLFCLFTMRPLCTQEWKELRWQYDSNPFPTFQFPSNSNSLSLLTSWKHSVSVLFHRLNIYFCCLFTCFNFRFCDASTPLAIESECIPYDLWCDCYCCCCCCYHFFPVVCQTENFSCIYYELKDQSFRFLFIPLLCLFVCMWEHTKKLRRWLFRLQNLVYFWYRAGGSFRFSLCYFVPSFCCRSIWLHRYLMKHKNRVFDYKLQMRTSTFLFYFSFRWFISSAEICQTSRKFFDYTHQETHSHFVQRFGEFISIKKSNWIVIHCDWEWIIRKFQFYRSFFSYEKRNKPQLNLILHVICHFWYMNQWVIMWTIISSIFQ